MAQEARQLTQYTPGPWKIEEYPESLEIWPTDLSKCCTRIAELMARPHYPGEAERSKANALLIAAVPELLEAAKLAKAELRYYPGETNKEGDALVDAAYSALEQAIAKAEQT